MSQKVFRKLRWTSLIPLSLSTCLAVQIWYLILYAKYRIFGRKEINKIAELRNELIDYERQLNRVNEKIRVLQTPEPLTVNLSPAVIQEEVKSPESSTEPEPVKEE